MFDKKEWRIKYYREHKDYNREVSKKYYHEHKEEIKESSKKYRDEHKEESLNRAKKYRADRKDEIVSRDRHFSLKKKYGLTVEEYENLFVKQNGVCAVCGEPETALSNIGKIKMLAVDHDHETGQVRGLLCNRCNTGIGLLGDNKTTLLKAVAYLLYKC